MALTDEDKAEIVALLAAQQLAPPEGEGGAVVVVEPEQTPAVIEAQADAAVAVIEAQAAADVRREHAHAETQQGIIIEQAKAEQVAGGAQLDDDGNIVDDLLQPEHQHPYFRKFSGGRK